MCPVTITSVTAIARGAFLPQEITKIGYVCACLYPFHPIGGVAASSGHGGCAMVSRETDLNIASSAIMVVSDVLEIFCFIIKVLV